MQLRSLQAPALSTSTLASWLVVVTIIGYAPVGLVGSVLGFGISPHFRAVEVLLSLYVFLRFLPGPQAWGRHVWLYAFLGIYLLRLLFDTFTKAPGDAFTALVFYLSVVIAPTLALSVVKPGKIDWGATAWRLLLISAGTCAGAIVLMQYGFDAAAAESGRLEAERLNTITLGHTAVTGLLAALCLVGERGWKRKAVLVALGAVCATALVLTGSRGPLVALVAGLVVYSIATRKFFWPLLLAGAGAFALLSQEDNILVLRLLLLIQNQGMYDESALERLEFQGRAWEQFLHSPMFGSGFAEAVSGTYPHNIVIESLMALGVVGGVLLVLVTVRAIRCSFTALRAHAVLPVLLLVQYAVNGQLSGSLWGSDAMWAMAAVVMAYGAPRRLPFRVHRTA